MHHPDAHDAACVAHWAHWASCLTVQREGAAPSAQLLQEQDGGASTVVVGAAQRERGAGRARTQGLSVQPLSACAGGTFGMGLPLRMMCMC